MSWKKYGGINKYEKLNNITVNSIVSDSITIRQSIVGNFNISGNLIVGDTIVGKGDMTLAGSLSVDGSFNLYNDAIVTGSVSIGENITVDGNVYLSNILYLGTEQSNYIFSDANGIGINVEYPGATLDIQGIRSEVLNVYTTELTNRNIIAQNGNNVGIAVNTNDTYSYIDFYNDISINTTTYNAKIQYKKGGVMTIDVPNGNTEILSTFAVSNRSAVDHVNNETAVIYDIIDASYLYHVYENSTESTGNALSLIAHDSSSNTFINIVTPEMNGFAIGGGSYPNDQSRSMGTLGCFDASNQYIPNQTIVSGSDTVKYKSTLGINTYSPRTDEYIVDINGPVHITNGELTTTATITNEIKQMNFSRIDKNYGIAIGTPYSVDTSNGIVYYRQNILYSENGGKHWTSVEVDKDSDLENNYPVNFTSGYMYDASYAVIVSDSLYSYYTNDSGKSWASLSLTELSFYPCKSVFISETIQNVSYNDLVYSANRIFMLFDASFVWFDTYFGSNNSLINSLSGSSVNIENSSAYTSSYTVESLSSLNGGYVASCGYGTNVYFVGNQIDKYSFTSSAVTFESTYNSDNSYNAIYAYDDNYVIAVGKYIISYTIDGGLTWTDISTDLKLTSVYILDSTNAMATSDSGSIIYTTNGSASWSNVSAELINASGNGERLINSSNKLNSIMIFDSSNSFIVSCVTGSYVSATNTGNSKIFYGFFPELFNASNNHILDLSGNMVISGDIHVNDNGGIISNNKTFSLLQNNVENIYFGTDASAIYIGDKNDGYTYIQNNCDFSSNVLVQGSTTLTTLTASDTSYFVGDATFNSNVKLTSDASYSLAVAGGIAIQTTDTQKKYIINNYGQDHELVVSGSSSFFGTIHIIGADTAVNILNGNLNALNATIATDLIAQNLTVNGSYTTSDYRIKRDPISLDSTFTVDNLNPAFYFNKISQKYDIGFIAHEVQQVYPYLVNGQKDGEKHQSLNYNGIIGILVKEIKDLKTRIDILESR